MSNKNTPKLNKTTLILIRSQIEIANAAYNVELFKPNKKINPNKTVGFLQLEIKIHKAYTAFMKTKLLFDGMLLDNNIDGIVSLLLIFNRQLNILLKLNMKYMSSLSEEYSVY